MLAAWTEVKKDMRTGVKMLNRRGGGRTFPDSQINVISVEGEDRAT